MKDKLFITSEPEDIYAAAVKLDESVRLVLSDLGLKWESGRPESLPAFKEAWQRLDFEHEGTNIRRRIVDKLNNPHAAENVAAGKIIKVKQSN